MHLQVHTEHHAGGSPHGGPPTPKPHHAKGLIRPFGFDFTAACWRHDFGYRNFLHGLALDPTSERKAAIDARLGTDLDTICRRHALWRKLCGQVAHLYVWAVRVAGH